MQHKGFTEGSGGDLVHGRCCSLPYGVINAGHTVSYR